MALVRYQSPDDPAFVVFDASRFRVDHAVFLLELSPLRAAIDANLVDRPDGGSTPIGLLAEYRRLEACREWLEGLDDSPDSVAMPGLEHQAAIDLVADRLIGDGAFDRAYCPACEAEHPADRVSSEPWAFEEGGVTVRGRRSTCSQGHTIHALIDEIDAPDLESHDVEDLP